MNGKRVRLGPGTRVLVVLAVFLMVSLGGGVASIYYTCQMQELLDSALGGDVAEYTVARELKIALLNQKGFATYYYLDGDTEWLEHLTIHRQAFETWLQKAREYSDGDREKELLQQIEVEYIRYVVLREQVINYYTSGNRDTGADLHWKVRKQFSELYDLCTQYVDVIEENLVRVRSEAGIRAKWFNGLAIATMATTLILGVLLACALITRILRPIRRLLMETGPPIDIPLAGDEVELLSGRVFDLIDDAAQARNELEQSKERLLQSEKMAVMGKLAADLAHSIRNPLTSIKMRLFSLERGLELSLNQEEDFEVVSEEMRRLDNIVRAFLEFSRRPKLKMQRLNISEVFDKTFQLLSHRLEQADIEVERPHRNILPEIEGDPELLKEAMVNLIVNAMDAMPEGGKITVSGEEAIAAKMGRVNLIRISDTGSGIPEQFHEKVFEAFFSTKEDGTGLGLPIVKRIIEGHGARIELRSEGAIGATFIITLPIKGDEQ